MKGLKLLFLVIVCTTGFSICDNTLCSTVNYKTFKDISNALDRLYISVDEYDKKTEQLFEKHMTEYIRKYNNMFQEDCSKYVKEYNNRLQKDCSEERKKFFDEQFERWHSTFMRTYEDIKTAFEKLPANTENGYDKELYENISVKLNNFPLDGMSKFYHIRPIKTFKDVSDELNRLYMAVDKYAEKAEQLHENHMTEYVNNGGSRFRDDYYKESQKFVEENCSRWYDIFRGIHKVLETTFEKLPKDTEHGYDNKLYEDIRAKLGYFSVNGEFSPKSEPGSMREIQAREIARNSKYVHI